MRKLRRREVKISQQGRPKLTFKPQLPASRALCAAITQHYPHSLHIVGDSGTPAPFRQGDGGSGTLGSHRGSRGVSLSFVLLFSLQIYFVLWLSFWKIRLKQGSYFSLCIRKKSITLLIRKPLRYPKRTLPTSPRFSSSGKRNVGPSAYTRTTTSFPSVFQLWAFGQVPVWLWQSENVEPDFNPTFQL